MLPAKVTHGVTLPSGVSFHIIKCPFHNLFSATLFCIFVLFWVILLLKMAPKHSVEVLSSVCKCKRAMIEKIHVLDKLHSVMTYAAIGCEFNVNESIRHIQN